MEIDSEIAGLFDDYRKLAKDARAAATLVLAQVQSKQHGDLHQTQQVTDAEFLTVKQAAKKYSLGERTVYRMVNDGLPATRVGKAIRIRPRDLAKHLEDSETILH